MVNDPKYNYIKLIINHRKLQQWRLKILLTLAGGLCGDHLVKFANSTMNLSCQKLGSFLILVQ